MLTTKQDLLRLLVIAIFTLVSHATQIYAQQGHYLVSHHAPDIESLDNVNFQIAVDSKGLLCLANRSGLLLFDGLNWDYIPTPSAALSVTLDSLDNIYIGCVGSFGKIGHKDGQIQYLPLGDSAASHELFFKSLYLNNTIYFLSESRLVKYWPEGDSIKHYNSKSKDEYFTDLFAFEGEILLQSDLGLYMIGKSDIENIKLPFTFDYEIQFIRKHPNNSSYLFGTIDNRIFSVENNKPIELKSSEYVLENSLYVNDIVWVDDDTYAISTLENGCLLFDAHKHELIEIVNNKTGLPDNEIYCIATDKEHGLWLAHEFGLARVESNIPVKNFSNYPGLEGNLMQVSHYEDELYVSTSHGVYYLDSEFEYKNSVYYTLKKKSKANTVKTQEQPARNSNVQNQDRITPNKKRALLKKIFSRKARGSIEKPDGEQQAQEPKKKTKTGIFSKIAQKVSELKETELFRIRKDDIKKNQKYERHVSREIVDTTYLYKPVSGISVKSKQFIDFKGHLIVAGNSGLYEVRDGNAELVIQEPIRYVAIDSKDEHLIISTYTNEVKVFDFVNDIWVETNSLEFYGEIILSILNDNHGRTWMASASKLFQLDSLDGNMESVEEYIIPNHFIDDVRLGMINDKVYIVNSLGYFYLDDAQKQVLADSIMYKKIGKPQRHLKQSDGIIWAFNGKKWHQIKHDSSVEAFEHLGLFPDMTFISRHDDEIWLIDNYNELFKFDAGEYDSLISKNKMFFKSIINNSGHVDMQGKMSFTHDNNTLQFILARPDYLGLLKVEYQYQLKGLTEKWSAWSSNNKLDFSYLPPNAYTLMVRSRDSFENIQESEAFEFRIKPPYWQTVWFYAFQILLMSMLVIGSARMNRRAHEKYVLITEGLTILTVVLIIEFLQTIAQNYFGIQSSPVADFGINVLVALSVFPLEQYLKKVVKADPSAPGLSGKGLFDLIRPPKPKNTSTA